MEERAYYADFSQYEGEERIVYGDYSVLKGPNGFECVLGEPEDRIWTRDGKCAVDELNRLYNENEELKAEIKKYKITESLRKGE